MKLTQAKLKQIIKEEVERMNPRYFLNEASKAEMMAGSGDGRTHLQIAIVKALRAGNHMREDNPLSLSALFDSNNGFVLRYMGELGLDDRAIKNAMSYAREYFEGGEWTDIDGRPTVVSPANVQVGPAQGHRGLYLAR